MLRQLLGCRRNGEQAVLSQHFAVGRASGSGNNICKNRFAAGYGSCLIQYDGLDTLRSFQMLAAFEQNPEFSRAARTCHN
ncbi:hypothetical protein D3C81_1997000 [compost metagenome]